jgi:hypothetical protein
MGGGFDLGKHEAVRRRLILVFIGADVAATVPGKAEIKADRGRAVQFLRRNVVAHTIDLIVGEPQDPIFRIEIHAHRITNAARKNFAARLSITGVLSREVCRSGAFQGQYFIEAIFKCSRSEKI